MGFAMAAHSLLLRNIEGISPIKEFHLGVYFQ
jgi:hypothetical protein